MVLWMMGIPVVRTLILGNTTADRHERLYRKNLMKRSVKGRKARSGSAGKSG